MDTKFKAALQRWLELAQDVVDTHMKKNFPSLQRRVLVLDRPGQRYVRVFEESQGGGRSCWAFIDLGNGDVLKPASWKAPAKHSRGNIFAENPVAGLSSYGPPSLR